MWSLYNGFRKNKLDGILMEDLLPEDESESFSFISTSLDIGDDSTLKLVFPPAFLVHCCQEGVVYKNWLTVSLKVTVTSSLSNSSNSENSKYTEEWLETDFSWLPSGEFSRLSLINLACLETWEVFLEFSNGMIPNCFLILSVFCVELV